MFCGGRVRRISIPSAREQQWATICAELIYHIFLRRQWLRIWMAQSLNASSRLQDEIRFAAGVEGLQEVLRQRMTETAQQKKLYSLGLQQPRLVYFQGDIRPWEEATIHVSTEAVNRGLNVFEGLKGYWQADES